MVACAQAATALTGNRRCLRWSRRRVVKRTHQGFGAVGLMSMDGLEWGALAYVGNIIAFGFAGTGKRMVRWQHFTGCRW